MSLPHFTEITGTTYYEYHPVDEPDNIRACSTTNRMLTNSLGNDGYNYYYTYATGIKTGSHDQAGYLHCGIGLRLWVHLRGVLFGVPLGGFGPPRGNAGCCLPVPLGVDQLESKTIAAQGDILTEVTLDYAWQKDTLQLVAKDNVSVMLPKSVDLSSIIVTVDVPESVQAPVERGQEVGTATMSYAGEAIATVTLVAAESVARSEMLQFISQGTSVLTSPWFLIIMGIICC